MSDQSFICGSCGKRHAGLPTDFAFGLPDEVFELSYLDTYGRARHNADLCTLDEKHFFIRGILPLPLGSEGHDFCFGVWVEVKRRIHDIYVDGFYDDLSALPRFAGTIANNIPGYGKTIGLPVEGQFQSGNGRPRFFFFASARQKLAREQRQGIDEQRHHEILDQLGVLDKLDGQED